MPEESTGITPIQEATETPVTTNGTTAESQQAQTATTQVRPLLTIAFHVFNNVFYSRR